MPECLISPYKNTCKKSQTQVDHKTQLCDTKRRLTDSYRNLVKILFKSFYNAILQELNYFETTHSATTVFRSADVYLIVSAINASFVTRHTQAYEIKRTARWTAYPNQLFHSEITYFVYKRRWNQILLIEYPLIEICCCHSHVVCIIALMRYIICYRSSSFETTSAPFAHHTECWM